MTADSPSACAPSLFVGAVGLTTLSAASLASRRALKRAVLARSAFRSAIYSAMVSAAHPWRVAQARLRGRSVECREVHAQALWTAIPGMVHVPA